MELYTLIKPLGMITIVLLLICASLGYFKLKIPNRLKWHKIFALLTIVAAVIHTVIVIYVNYG